MDLLQDDVHAITHLERVRRSLRIDPYYVRRLRHALLRQGREDAEALERLPADVRQPFQSQVRLHPLTLVAQQGSSLDGSTKRLYQTRNGDRLESVVLATPTGRVSLCISSQVGCRAGCQFCATATMPSVVNLSTGEILDQLVQANQFLRPRGQRVRNIVFMGMGEPLHNEDAVTEALEILVGHGGFNFSPQKVVVSSVGVPDAMLRVARRFPKLRLALSLHSANPEVRRQLIPLGRRHGLESLRETVREIAAMQQHHVMIQYLMLDGVTDRDEDCELLLEWLRGLDVYVNLIPYNSIGPGDRFQATPQPRRDEFAKRLRDAGYMTYIRYSQGADIDAACGQLATRD